jgi:glycosyltransferase involved in cell wall biosynthesis
MADVRVLLLIDDASQAGGTNRVVADIANCLSTDMTVALASLEGRQTAYRYNPTIECFFLANRLSESPRQIVRTANIVGLLPRLRRLVQQWQPDVVMSFLPRANLANILTQTTLRRRTYRTIINARNFNSVQYERTRSGRVYKRVLRWAYPRADLALANAEALAVNLTTDFGVPPAKTGTIHNPFDRAMIERRGRETPDMAGIPSDVPIILNVARLTAHKRHALLLKAFAEVYKEVPTHLVIVGEGPERGRLESLSAELKLREHVSLLGWRDNPFAYMRHADVFVLTSDFEGFPSVLVEAMICGCPVISADCPSGPKEILENGQYGILIPVGDQHAITQALLSLLQNPQRREQLAQLGQQRAATFDMEQIAEQYKTTIRELVTV